MEYAKAKSGTNTYKGQRGWSRLLKRSRIDDWTDADI